MIARAVAGTVGLVGGATTAVTSGGTDLTGIAAIITSIVGALALAWTIYQGTRRKRQIDLDAAAELIELLEKRHRDDT